VIVPAGLLEITEPIIWPARTGYSLLGVGSSRDINDATYAGNGIGGQVSRILWRGVGESAPNDAMLSYRGFGGTVERIHFQGRPVPLGGKPSNEPPGAKVSEATNSSPIVITSANHGLATGNTVVVQDCLGNTAANGAWTVTVLGPDRFSLNGSKGNGAYTSTPTAGRWDDPKRKATVGIKVNTVVSGGSVLNSGKLALRDCSFYQLRTGVLFGANMDNLGKGSFPGDTDNNADESSLSNLRFYYPYDDNPAKENRTCFRFRTNQAVGFNASDIRVLGNPNEVFYFESGGRLDCTNAVLSGACSARNPSTVLRIGKTYASCAWFRIHCDIDGYSGTSGDNIGGYFKLIQMGTSRAGDVYVEYSGVIGPISYATPIVTARGACTIVLRGVYGLNPKSLQLIGNVVAGAEKRVCNLHLDGCTLRGCDWPSDLVTTADDPNAPSKGPWRLTWTNCTRIAQMNNSEGYAIPFVDSTAATAVESKNILPGTISGP
jgi:hypothetical protein